MSFYIGRYGKILICEGKRTEQPLDTSCLGFENRFEDKERAIYFRDKLREEHPRLFLKEKSSSNTTSNKKTLSQDDFREQMRQEVSKHLDTFWDMMSELKPQEYVNAWLKAASYGFSRAPSEKEIDDDEKQKQQQREQQRKQELIDRGIQ